MKEIKESKEKSKVWVRYRHPLLVTRGSIWWLRLLATGNNLAWQMAKLAIAWQGKTQPYFLGGKKLELYYVMLTNYPKSVKLDNNVSFPSTQKRGKCSQKYRAPYIVT